jgi:hypothetical protein
MIVVLMSEHTDMLMLARLISEHADMLMLARLISEHADMLMLARLICEHADIIMLARLTSEHAHMGVIPMFPGSYVPRDQCSPLGEHRTLFFKKGPIFLVFPKQGPMFPCSNTYRGT